jgi:hypothetical protein
MMTAIVGMVGVRLSRRVVEGAEPPLQRRNSRARGLRRVVLQHGGFVLALAAILARPAAAQDQRLERLSPETRALVVPVMDSARAAGLPTGPLLERALEGTSKHAAPELIAQVVRRVANDLARAREALGPDGAPEALAAGADALHAGVTPALLQRVAGALRGQRMTVPLAVLADLTARGVPADTAATLTLARARSTSDADLLALERDVERDIALGATPLTATTVRFTGDAPAALAGEPGLTGTSQPSAPKPHKP